MQHYDINIPVGGVREINVQGDYVYYLSGSAGGADSAITLRNISGSDTVILRPGQAYRLGSGAENVRWVIGNHAGQGTIIGLLLMGAGEFSDNRISGSVEVIDGGKNRVMAGVCFLAGPGQGALAGQFSHCQLWNPGGTGKNLIVEKIFVSASIAGEIDFGKSTAQIANLHSTPANKNFGSAAVTVAQGRIQVNATLMLTGTFGSVLAAANQSLPYDFNEPVIVVPGSGLLVQCTVANATLIANFEYFEDAI